MITNHPTKIDSNPLTKIDNTNDKPLLIRDFLGKPAPNHGFPEKHAILWCPITAKFTIAYLNEYEWQQMLS